MHLFLHLLSIETTILLTKVRNETLSYFSQFYNRIMSLAPAPLNLIEKLGIKEDNYIIVVNQPDNYFGLINDLPDGVKFVQVEDNLRVDFIHVFARNQYELIHELFACKPLLKSDGKIWIFYPKKSSRVKTDLDVNTIINFGNDIHLKNIQLTDFDSVWTGVEFKIPND